MPKHLITGTTADQIAFTPFGDLSAMSAGAALRELDTEKAPPGDPLAPTAPPFYKRVPGFYYTVPGIGKGALSTPTLDRLYLLKAWPTDELVTVDRIFAQVTSLVPGAVLRLGIYSLAGGRPSTLILDAGTIDGAAGGTSAKEIAIGQVLDRGAYSLACAVQGGVPGVRSVAAGAGGTGGLFGSSTLATVVSTNSYVAWYVDGVSGSLPASVTPTNLTDPAPLVGLRVAP